MRIAIFHNLSSGGAKRALADVTRRLTTHHQLDVYTLSCADHEFADLRPAVAAHRVFPFAASPRLKSPFGRINPILQSVDLARLRRVARAMARQIEAIAYDAVLVQPCRFEQGPSVLRYLRRIPTIYYCHEPLRLVHEAMPSRPYDGHSLRRRRVLDRIDPLPGLYRRAVRHTDRTNVRSAKRVLVNSRFTGEAVRRIYGVEAELCYLGVDAERFRPTGAEKRHMVLSVGSLTPLKGFDFVIRALAEVPQRTRPLLVIASNSENPPERRYLEDLAQRLDVKLVLTGNITDEALVALYNEALVVAYAPVREPFGLVPLEAMACATPVVAVAEGGIQETVVSGVTGLLVDRDIGRFAAAIGHLTGSPTVASEYGQNGRTHVLQHWTWDHAIASLEHHLARVSRAGSR
jgi:glycosyltransferase involved in cell wall biosynthesis